MNLEVEEEVNSEEKEEKCTHAYKQESKGVEGTAQGHSCGDRWSSSENKVLQEGSVSRRLGQEEILPLFHFYHMTGAEQESLLRVRPGGLYTNYRAGCWSWWVHSPGFWSQGSCRVQLSV